jgi:L-asparaginase II
MDAYVPLIELTRGPLVESIHFGALAVVDVNGRLLASAGSPDLMANLRSSAKPFQILSFVEAGGLEYYNWTDEELAIACASHSGTDEHTAVLRSIQARIGVTEADLLCGTHYPLDEATTREMRARAEKPTPNRHNCSGKHTGMLANARMRNFSIQDYLNPQHPLQRIILDDFAAMVGIPSGDVPVGIDGCSAPTFAAPLRQAAHAYALLADPSSLPPRRTAALRRIFHAMSSYPNMVAGPQRFDTLLMQATHGKIASKGGAEGYQGIAIRPGVLYPGSPAMGLTLKIADGDPSGRAVSYAAFAALEQLGVLDETEREQLKQFGPRTLRNWRELEIGESRAAFSLHA